MNLQKRNSIKAGDIMNEQEKIDLFAKRYKGRVLPAGAPNEYVKEAEYLVANKKTPEDDLFIIEGDWALNKIIDNKIKVKSFIFCPDFIKTDKDRDFADAMIGMAQNSFAVTYKICKKISDREGPDGFYTVCRYPNYTIDDIRLKDDNLILILDGLEQPGNIGNIIRSLDGAGGDGVIVCHRKVKPTHSRLIRSSLGAAFLMPVVEMDFDEMIDWLKRNGFKIFLTDLRATKGYYEMDYRGRCAIVAGNEHKGVSKDWENVEASRIIIPMFGTCESLSVGFASTLVAYHASLMQKGLIAPPHK